MGLTIRPIKPGDRAILISLSREVAFEGSTYVFNHDTTDQQILDYWIPSGGQTFLAVIGDEVAGVYKINANQIGRGSHIANASYLVTQSMRGSGIGKKMAEHSLKIAKESGFSAIQFNLVVSTNNEAISLWKKLEFKIIGAIPRAFHHESLGFVDAYVMYREI